MSFGGCESLENIIIPSSVIKIGNDAFGQCASITVKYSKDSPAHKYAEENRIKFELI